jgi:hypothetical protein
MKSWGATSSGKFFHDARLLFTIFTKLAMSCELAKFEAIKSAFGDIGSF